MKQIAWTKVPFILQRMALVLFSILPVGIALWLQTGQFVWFWDRIAFFRAGFLAVALLVPLFLFLGNQAFWQVLEKSEKWVIVWLIFITLSFRLFFVPLINTGYVSDFLDIHLFAIDVVSGYPLAHLNDYSYIPYSVYLNTTGLLIAFLYKLFGATVTVSKVFMIALSGVTTGLIYLAGKEISADKRVGFIAALGFALFPSLIVYTGTLSGEHIALPLIMLAAILFSRLQRMEQEKLLLRVCLYGTLGIILGLIDWFRPIGLTILIAFIITDLLYTKKAKLILYSLAPLAVLFVAYHYTSDLSVVISERLFARPIPSVSQRTGEWLFIGLNPETHGVHSAEDAAIIFGVYERFGSDKGAARSFLIKAAFERMQPGDIFTLLRFKLSRAWSNHDMFFEIAGKSSRELVLLELMSFMDIWMNAVLVFFVFIGTCASLIKRSYATVFAFQLVILGFALTTLLFEAQNRYMIVVFPFLLLLGALGYTDFLAFMHKIKTRALKA